MFCHKLIILHMIDRCARWYHALEVNNKEEEELINAIDSWCNIHGPQSELLVDQETANYRSAKARYYFRHKGIKVVPRATGQQVTYIRDVIHNIVSQLQAEGVECPFSHVLSEATFCSNALLSINQCTPYNAVYGRVLALLPGLDQIESPHEASLSMPGTAL